MDNKEQIKEIIVVEGKEDTAAIKRAVSAVTIETHGYGIKKETWKEIEQAYSHSGIIIFTDPDHAGEEIRKKILAKFPDAKQAFISRDQADKSGDIGIENASEEDIIEALEKAHCSMIPWDNEFSMDDLIKDGLVGRTFAAERRRKLAEILGIGYANAKGTLKKLNAFGISRDAYNEAIRCIDTND